MDKYIQCVGRLLKETILFLVYYRQERQLLRAEEIGLKQQCQVQEIAMWRHLGKEKKTSI